MSPNVSKGYKYRVGYFVNIMEDVRAALQVGDWGGVLSIVRNDPGVAAKEVYEDNEGAFLLTAILTMHVFWKELESLLAPSSFEARSVLGALASSLISKNFS